MRFPLEKEDRPPSEEERKKVREIISSFLQMIEEGDQDEIAKEILGFEKIVFSEEAPTREYVEPDTHTTWGEMAALGRHL